jgi:uncharacterized membrane protein YraQ (UPF0718 family)
MIKKSDTTENKKANKEKKFPVFLVGVIVIYGLVALIDYELVEASLGAVRSIFLNMIPIFLVVFVLMTLSNLFLSPGRVKKHFGKKAGLKGWLYAIVFGIIVAGPPYILYPMLKDLKKNGVKNSHLAVFLYNRNVKLPFIPAMIYYFGWQYTVTLSVLIMVFSIFNGLLVGRVTK